MVACSEGGERGGGGGGGNNVHNIEISNTHTLLYSPAMEWRLSVAMNTMSESLLALVHAPTETYSRQPYVCSSTDDSLRPTNDCHAPSAVNGLYQ